MTKLQHYNILLVEDEALLLQSLIRNINALDAGFRVAFQAADGRKALQVLKNKNVHLVITDIRMPPAYRCPEILTGPGRRCN